MSNEVEGVCQMMFVSNEVCFVILSENDGRCLWEKRGRRFCVNFSKRSKDFFQGVR